MTRLSRYRSRSRTYKGRFRDWVSGSPNSWTSVSLTRDSSCSDFRGRPVTDSPFDSEQRDGCLRLSGTIKSAYQPQNNRITELDEYPLSPSISSSYLVPIAAPGGWGLTVIARTNPSRPVMTPLTLLQDLIELPRMLAEVPSLLKNPSKFFTPKGASNAYLGTLFGWMPLVQDVKQLLDLGSAIDKRCKELNRLYTARGLRRRIEMGSEHVAVPVTVSVAGQGSAIYYVPVSAQIEKKAWATITWRPASPVPYHPGDASQIQLARKIVLGMTSEGMAKGLWDVLPWTWIVNWFTNVGQYALAHSNTVPATHTAPCFMSKVVVQNVPGVPYSSGTLGCDVKVTCDMTYERRTRTVSTSSSPGCYVPFLDTSRLSILTALFIQRFR